MLGEVGGDELRRYTVTGSTVNIAHRLVGLTKSGEIIVSSDVYNQLGTSANSFMFIGSAPIKLKGIEAPQTLYKLHVPNPSKN